MPQYTYKARDASGKKVSGEMEAANKADLISRLHAMGYMTTGVSEAGGGASILSVFTGSRRIKYDDLFLFYVQLANMIGAGITILKSLSTLASQAQNKRFKGALEDVIEKIESGSTLSQAFAAHPDIFPRLFMNMIKVGEASGNLDKILMQYARFFESQGELEQKVKGALVYPVVLLCAGLTIMLFVVTFVIPQFASIYVSSGIKLPVPTRIILATGNAMRHYWYVALFLGIAAFLGIRRYASTMNGTRLIDKLKLTMPLTGTLYKKIVIVRFSRMLATLLGSGVPILQSLDITKDVIGNSILEHAIENVRDCVEKGDRMAEPLKVSREFPEDVVQMVAVGEESGSLDTMLGKIADFYDMTVGYSIKKLTVMIEPAFLIVMGGMVGLIVASILLPIFSMVNVVK